MSGRSGLGLQMGQMCLQTTELWPLIDVKCVFPQYLPNKWMNFDKILYIH